MQKAFEGQQEKEETPTEWPERLQRNMKQYSGIDPETTARQVLLRVNFVTLAWPDSRKKLEKMKDWHERSLNDLLKEAQKVYVRRDEEKAKVEAKIMVAMMQERNFQRQPKPPCTSPRHSGLRHKEKQRNRQWYKQNPNNTLRMSVSFARRKDITNRRAPTQKGI